MAKSLAAYELATVMSEVGLVIRDKWNTKRISCNIQDVLHIWCAVGDWRRNILKYRSETYHAEFMWSVYIPFERMSQYLCWTVTRCHERFILPEGISHATNSRINFICDCSRTCNYEYYYLLGCDTMLSGRKLSTFQGNLLVWKFQVFWDVTLCRWVSSF